MDSYLRADAKSHTIKVQLKSSDIDHIKSIIRTAPRHVEAAYRWPFEGPIAKFTSKDIKEYLARDFQPILDGRGKNLKEYTGNLGDLTINDVMKGTRVSIEYMLVPYGGKKPKENDEGFVLGCALKLYSITVLEMTNEKVVRLDTSSPGARGENLLFLAIGSMNFFFTTLPTIVQALLSIKYLPSSTLCRTLSL